MMLRFSWRLLRRDLASGEIRLLWLALVVAVGAVTAVSFFTDRLRRGMEGQANALLAADLVVESAYPLPQSLRDLARTMRLATVESSSFRSMVSRGDRLILAEVKAVGEGYPLRGHLEVATDVAAAGAPTADIPKPGAIWIEGSLLTELGAGLGAQVGLGDLSVRIDRVLSFEPDRGGDAFNIAPRVLMHEQDLPATHLIQLGSRVQYRLLVAGPPAGVADYRRRLGPLLPHGARPLAAREARPELGSALERADQFLALAALCAVLLAGIAIGIAARRFSARHLDGAAVMRCLGATAGFLLTVFALEILMLGLVASLAGSLLGFGAAEALVLLLGRMTSISPLPAASLWPVAQGCATALVALGGFALPPLLHLYRVPPVRVLQRDRGSLAKVEVVAVPLALGALVLLAPWAAGSATLTGLILLGTLGTLAGLGAIGWALVWLLQGVRGRLGVAWRYGIANIARRAGGSIVQVAGLGVGMMVILVLTVVRADLFTSWRAALPADAHNHFLINVQTADLAPLRAFFQAEGRGGLPLYPMVRAQLSRHNGRVVKVEDYEEPRARRLVDRPLNLSFTTNMPPENRVTAGRFWAEAKPGAGADTIPPQFSVETGIAESFGLKLGDEISFRIAEQEVTGKITSLRAVQWDTFHVNFFVIGTPALLAGQPTTYITSFHLSATEKGLVRRLGKRFPGITVVDVEALIAHVRAVMDRANSAVEFVFLFSLAAGLLILAAAIGATHDERLIEGAVLKALGARRRTILAGLLAEFAVLGGVAGLVAALGAAGMGAILALWVFHVPYTVSPVLFLAGPPAGIAIVVGAGLFGTRSIFRQSPAAVLRGL